ncbi:MAG TPA: GAF domain-containing sensor histidine kinase [Terriglobia bacterium]|jgi:C4-dicarboxylate-specific signal transduction histidine kinase
MKEQSSNIDLHRLQVLLEAARLLNSTLELNEITQIILDVVRPEVHVERLSVFVVDRAKGVLRSIVAHEVNNRDIFVPLGIGIAGTVAKTGEVLDIPDAYADPRFARAFDQRLGYHTKDLFTLPVCDRKGEIIGVLQLLNRLRPITDSDREFLLGISVYIGLALQNAWSHAQLREEESFGQSLLSLCDRLAETERLSLTSQAFNYVVREISNPLAVAMGYTDLAHSHPGVPEQVRGYLTKISQGIDQTATAARQFRSFINSAAPKLRPIALSDVLWQITHLRAQQWAAQNIDASMLILKAPPVLADEAQMQLVVLYLLQNAEATLGDGDPSRELRITLSAGGEQVRVEISRTGPASGEELQTRIYESPFTGTKQLSVSTLGLALASGIVEQHNGRLRLESGGDKGDTLVVELPAYLRDAAG